MKKVWIFVIAGFLLVTAIGVGGKVYMDKKEEEKQAEKIEVERKSVEALKERYANIKYVEFEKSVYDNQTGAYIMFIKMTNRDSKSANFRFTYWSGEKEVGSATLEDEEVQHKGITKNIVEVVYSNNSEGEV